MNSLFIIIAILFLALFIIVPLVERYGKRHSPEQLNKMTRWIFPLMLVLIVLQLISHYF